MILDYIKHGSKFEFLQYLSDIKQFLKKDNYTITEFKQEMPSKALINLYLSSLTQISPSGSTTESSSNVDVIEDNDRLHQEQRKQSIMA